MSIYKSTLNTSKQKQKKQKPEKIKVKHPPIISKGRFALISLLVISAVCFVALCLPQNFVKNLMLGLFGLSAYPVCVLLAFLCAMSLGKTKYEINKRYVAYLTCALFFVLMIIHLILTTRISLDSYSQYLADTYGLKTSGAGLIMSLFTYWMKKYLTVVGAYILAAIMLTVFIGLIVDSKNNIQPKEEQPEKKSNFDFGGLISEQKSEDVPVTIKHQQDDLKKKIAKQKLGLESGSSTIISSSMRLDEIPDTPKKYRSKKEYILTPPEITIPTYDKPIESVKNETFNNADSGRNIFGNTNSTNMFANSNANNLFSKVNTNSDIFVTDTEDFYKDAKVIEGKDINIEANKIQEVSPIQPNAFNQSPIDSKSQFTQQSNLNQTFDYIANEIKPKEEVVTSEDDAWEDVDNIDLEEDLELEDDIEAINATPIQETSIKQNDIQFARPNTAEVVHTSSFNTQPNVYTREVVEEKKEENLLGKPKKYHPEYVKPPASLLEYLENVDVVSEEECNENIEKLERVLEDFKINAKVKAVQVGPAVTRYEIGMPQGVSVKKVQFHADDIAMALASNGSIRIEAPIPGKNAVGIEVPNRTVMGVSLREMIESLDFQKRINPMSFVLGKDINGSIQFCNLDKMPHLLVAGSTGSGKSVCLNTMLISMLYKSSPEDVRLILIDPKTVEFSTYANLPHLLTPHIITTKEQTINALNWAIKEMEYRYGLLQRNQVVNIKEYNSLDIVKNNEVEKLPYIVIVIDELGDLMIEAKREMEERIMKLAQKSRAAGIHLVIATQRPSVDVITGTIKANLPSRIAFALTNFADSKTVLDMGGAEKLLGKGDMLFKPSDLPEPRRVQGAYISSREVASVVKFIKENNRADFDDDALKAISQTAETASQNVDGDTANFDPVLKDALRFFIQANQASITMIQRRFGVGYARAARIIDQMEQNGFISQADGSKPRQVLISLEEYNLLFNS